MSDNTLQIQVYNCPHSLTLLCTHSAFSILKELRELVVPRLRIVEAQLELRIAPLPIGADKRHRHHRSTSSCSRHLLGERTREGTSSNGSGSLSDKPPSKKRWPRRCANAAATIIDRKKAGGDKSLNQIINRVELTDKLILEGWEARERDVVTAMEDVGQLARSQPARDGRREVLFDRIVPYAEGGGAAIFQILLHRLDKLAVGAVVKLFNVDAGSEKEGRIRSGTRGSKAVVDGSISKFCCM